MGEAELLCRQALAIWQAILGTSHPRVARGLDAMSSLLKDQVHNVLGGILEALRAVTYSQGAFVPYLPESFFSPTTLIAHGGQLAWAYVYLLKLDLPEQPTSGSGSFDPLFRQVRHQR